MQYTYVLSSGRVGLSLDIHKCLPVSGIVDNILEISLNQKGFSATLHDVVDPVSAASMKKVCDFESFVYPGDIEQEELDFISVVNGPFEKWVMDSLGLCSLLCAQWSAGHTEEMLHESIRNTLRLWNS